MKDFKIIQKSTGFTMVTLTCNKIFKYVVNVCISVTISKQSLHFHDVIWNLILVNAFKLLVYLKMQA